MRASNFRPSENQPSNIQQHNTMSPAGALPRPLPCNHFIMLAHASESNKHRHAPVIPLGSIMKNTAETKLHVNLLTLQRHHQADRKNTPVDDRNNNELLSGFLRAVCFHSCTAQTPV